MTARSPLAPRAGYESLRTYSPGMDAECAIDLGDNTNLWGASPAAARALGAAIGAGVTRYPSRGMAHRSSAPSRSGTTSHPTWW